MKSKPVVVITFFVFLVLIIGYFYFVLKTRVQDVSDQAPFPTFLNQKLGLERDVLLVKNPESFSYEHIYMIVEVDTDLLEEMTVEKVLETGTEIIFTNAKIFTNGVSGASHCMLLGTVYLDSQEIKFEFSWGEKSMLLDKNNEDFWIFPKPIWKGALYNDKYYF